MTESITKADMISTLNKEKQTTASTGNRTRGQPRDISL
jgi:hypothetical protein